MSTSTLPAVPVEQVTYGQVPVAAQDVLDRVAASADYTAANNGADADHVDYLVDAIGFLLLAVPAEALATVRANLEHVEVLAAEQEADGDLDRCSTGCVCTPAERWDAGQPGAYVRRVNGAVLECFDDEGEAEEWLREHYSVDTHEVVVVG